LEGHIIRQVLLYMLVHVVKRKEKVSVSYMIKLQKKNLNRTEVMYVIMTYIL